MADPQGGNLVMLAAPFHGQASTPPAASPALTQLTLASSQGQATTVTLPHADTGDVVLGLVAFQGNRLITMPDDGMAFVDPANEEGGMYYVASASANVDAAIIEYAGDTAGSDKVVSFNSGVGYGALAYTVTGGTLAPTGVYDWGGNPARTTATLPDVTGLAAGDLLLVAASWCSTSASTTPTPPTTPAGFTLAGEAFTTSGTRRTGISLFTATADDDTFESFTVTGASGQTLHLGAYKVSAA